MTVHLFSIENHLHNKNIIHCYNEFVSNGDDLYFIFGNKKVREHYVGLSPNEHVLFIDSWLLLFIKLAQAKTKNIVVHGDSFLLRVFVACFFANYSIFWVSWGSGISLSDNFIFQFFKKYIYSKYSRVILLSKGDELRYNFNYGFPCIQLTYLTKLEILFSTRSKKDYLAEISKRKILLGNNVSCISSYYDLLRVLRLKAGDFEVKCLVNGDNPHIKEISDLEEYGKILFNNSFQVSTEIVELENYLEEIEECSVYFCGVDFQSGLGVIYACLFLGKKLYLTGSNLDHISGLGFKVHSLSDLNDCTTDEIFSIDASELLHNIQLASELFSVDRIVASWKNLLS